ncbi:intermembrane phospholipid transport protein YdbH family protein [Zavarzinia sp.]|uniref:intermembrane phospholipid transport protein YdbH family protein n=1 Tax=Zavarzinia sp. TaxID=2027920 RepID=UPI003BB79CF6
MNKDTQTRRRTPWARILAAGLAILLVLTAGFGLAAWIWRVDLARVILVRVIEGQGFGPVAFSLDRVDFTRIDVSALRLRGGAIAAEHLAVDFELSALLDGRVGTITLAGLDLDLADGPSGLEAGGRPLIAPGTGDAAGGDASGGGASGIDIGALALDGARVTYRSGADSWRVVASTTLSLAGNHVAADVLTASVEGPPGKAALTAGKLALDLPAAGGLGLELAAVAIDLPGLPWALSDAAISLRLTDAGLETTVTGAVLRNLQQPPLLIPVSLSGQAGLVGDTVEFSLKAAPLTLGNVTLDIAGRYDMASAALAATLALPPVRFASGGLQPVDISPRLGSMPGKISGGVGLSGKLTWQGGKLASDLALALDDLGFVGETASVSALNGTIRITRPWPLTTAPRQRVSATVSSGGESAVVEFTGQLLAKPALKVETVTIRAAGGTLTSGAFTATLDRPAISTVIEVAHVDLAEVTRVLGLDGLSGTGFLDGRIPIEVAGDRLVLTDGALKAQGPGTLSYRPGNLPPQIAAAGREMELTLQALSDFHYDSLAIEFAKAAEGEGYVLLKMAGGNPVLLPGQPFNFNIRLESNFARLADLVLLGLRSAQDLLGRATGRLQQ